MVWFQMYDEHFLSTTVGSGKDHMVGKSPKARHRRNKSKSHKPKKGLLETWAMFQTKVTSISNPKLVKLTLKLYLSLRYSSTVLAWMREICLRRPKFLILIGAGGKY